MAYVVLDTINSVMMMMMMMMSLDNIISIRATRDAIRFYDPNNENAAEPRQLMSLFRTRVLRTCQDCREISKSFKIRNVPKRQLMLLTKRNRDSRLQRRWHCRSMMKNW